MARFLLIKGKKQNIMSKEKDIKKETEEMETSKAKQAENAPRRMPEKTIPKRKPKRKRRKTRWRLPKRRLLISRTNI